MPASFPGAVKTFATRTAGQTIDPGHLNDLQDEVTALEAGYINGTAPLNSSNATMVALTVTDITTLTSSVVIGGKPYIFPSSAGSTGQVLMVEAVGGSTMRLEWRDVSAAVTASIAATPSVGVLLTHSAIQAIASDSAAWTGLNWDTEDDPFSMHSTSVNSSRVNFSPSTGRYLIGATVSFDKKSLVERQVALRVNDSSRVAGQGGYSLNSITQSITVTALVRAASTSDYFTVGVTSADGGSSVVAHSTGAPTRAWAKFMPL